MLFSQPFQYLLCPRARLGRNELLPAAMLVMALSSATFLSQPTFGDERQIEIKLTQMKFGYSRSPNYDHLGPLTRSQNIPIPPRIRSKRNRNRLIAELEVPAERGVIIGGRFQIESNVGERLQIAAILSRAKKYPGPNVDYDSARLIPKSAERVVVDVVQNGAVVSFWHQLRTRNEWKPNTWTLTFVLVAHDDDIETGKPGPAKIARGIPIVSRTFTVSRPD